MQPAPQLEILPTAQFRRQLATPMGMTSVDGSWHADPSAQQITLQGRQSNGFQVVP